MFAALYSIEFNETDIKMTRFNVKIETISI